MSPQKNKCLNCGDLISRGSKRCRSCSRKGKLNPNFGKKATKYLKFLKQYSDIKIQVLMKKELNNLGVLKFKIPAEQNNNTNNS
jgi:hypothetical protein